jgi:hypothetical protein
MRFEDGASDARLDLSSVFPACAQAVADKGPVTEEGVLDFGLLGVSGPFFHVLRLISRTRSMVRSRGLARVRGLRDDVAAVDGGTTTLAPRLLAASYKAVVS